MAHDLSINCGSNTSMRRGNAPGTVTLKVRGPYSNNTSPPSTGTLSDCNQPPSWGDFSKIVMLLHRGSCDSWSAEVRPVMPPPMTAALKSRRWDRGAGIKGLCAARRLLDAPGSRISATDTNGKVLGEAEVGKILPGVRGTSYLSRDRPQRWTPSKTSWKQKYYDCTVLDSNNVSVQGVRLASFR